MKTDSTAKPIPLGKLKESPTNPRVQFGDLAPLTQSIRTMGVLQPILVRPAGKADGYEIVFGHRRYRAAKMAGLKEIPAIVREMETKEVVEAQLVENLQREDIHPLEEAEGFRRLHTEFGYSVDEIAERLGRSRSMVFDTIKLLELSEDAKKALLAGKLSFSTAVQLARIKGDRVQARALADVTKVKGGEPMSFRQAAKLLKAKYSAVREPSEKVKESKAKKVDEGAEMRERVASAAVANVVQQIEQKPGLETPELRMMAMALVQLPSARPALLRRKYDAVDQALIAIQKKLSQAELRALVFELSVGEWLGSSREGYTAELKAMVNAFDLKLSVLEHDLLAAAEKEAKHAEAEALFTKLKK